MALEKNNSIGGQDYQKQAAYYDTLYSDKDYASEVKIISNFIKEYPLNNQRTLLDVGCGTGNHLEYFKQQYFVEGLDISSSMLEIAREKLSSVRFYQSDMSDFSLSKKYDVITCLFGAIGWTKTLEKMRKSVLTMANHLNDNGLLIVEPWFSSNTWQSGIVSTTSIDNGSLQITRTDISFNEGLDFYFKVRDPSGVSCFKERHKIGLFTLDEYSSAFRDIGLDLRYDSYGVNGRGLFIANK